MTVWYNWWTTSGWYIIDVFPKRCIYILHQAAGTKTLFRNNLEMRLLKITPQKLSSPCSTNWAKMQNTCNDGLGQKVALHHVARFTFFSLQSEWIGCLLTLSSSEDKSLSTLLKSLSAPKTQFSTLDILWLLFFKIPKRKRCWWWKYFFPQQSFPTLKLILLVAEAFSPNYLVQDSMLKEVLNVVGYC